MKTTFQARRVVVLMVVGLVMYAGLEAYQTYTLSRAASDLEDVSEDVQATRDSTTRIETIVKPICVPVAPECRQILRAADEGLVAQLCQVTADILRESDIDAECRIDAPDRPEVEKGQPDPTPSGSGPRSSSPPGSTPLEPATPGDDLDGGSSAPGPDGGGDGGGLLDEAGDVVDEVRDQVCHLNPAGIRICL